MHISYLVKQLFPSCVWLNGKLQFSVHRGDSYTNLIKKKNNVEDKILCVKNEELNKTNLIITKW